MDLSKINCSGAPFLLFISFFFIFSLFLCGLIGSFYLSLICPLWDLLICPLLGSLFVSSLGYCPHFKGKLYILQGYRRSHTLQEVLIIKKTEKYHNVCLCQCSRICNGTSASCSNYKGKAQLACDSMIKQKYA